MMRRSLLLIVWLLTDYLLFLGAYALAYFMRVGWIFSSDLPFRHYMTAVALSGVAWLPVLITTRTFGLTRNQMTARNAAYIVYAAVMGVALVALAYFFLFQHVFSRMLVLYAFGLSAAATFIWHVVFERCMRMLLRTNPPAYPTLLVGVTRESRQLLKLLRTHRNPLKPVAIIDVMGVPEKMIEGVPVIGKLNRLEEALQTYGITHVVQCSDLEQSINLLSACRARGITYMLLPSVLGIVEQNERIESLEGKAVAVVSPDSYRWNWFFR
jgi:FlaA1/EpsC-like NDP-sugar epimerase